MPVRLAFSAGLARTDREFARKAELGQLLRGALRDLSLPSATVNLRLATPAELRRLNRKFAGQDHETDVLAFPATGDRDSGFQLPASEVGFLGDVVISVRTAAAQAELVGEDPPTELRLLAVHGLLHLIGHDHERAETARRMTRATQLLLDGDASRRGIPAPRVPVLQPAE